VVKIGSEYKNVKRLSCIKSVIYKKRNTYWCAGERGEGDIRMRRNDERIGSLLLSRYDSRPSGADERSSSATSGFGKASV
jgi:hypothetical protein